MAALWALGISIGWLAYVYVGYPVLLWIVGCFRRVRPRQSGEYLPTVSVLLSARNEAKDIGWKLRETLGWDYPADRLEVLVASDASDDGTDGIVAGIHDPRLRFVRNEVRTGKVSALNRLGDLAHGEILFFTDANSHIEAGALRRMVRHFADERVGCVTGEMLYTAESTAEAASAQSERAYWGFESLVKRLESRIGAVLVCVGSVHCLRRELFSLLDPEIANDMETPLRLARGRWVLYEPAVCSVERVAANPKEEYGRRRRIVSQGVLGMWRLRSKMGFWRVMQFASRKLLRWLCLVPAAVAFGASALLADEPVFAAALAAQVILYTAALAGWLLARSGRSAGILTLPMFVLLVNLAALSGIVSALRGSRFHVWDIAALSRGTKHSAAGQGS